ncbi:MAG: T9SS type A sorting domain-containing protein [Chitinophagales bacterium]|nr:T9SS type A sorting domain-containing protein [Chitinophagales bacterium]
MFDDIAHNKRGSRKPTRVGRQKQTNMRNKILLSTILCFAMTQTIFAQWTATTGPTQPNVVSVSTSGANTFAAAGSAVSITSNNGTNWAIANNGLAGTIYSVATKGTDVFAGASAGAVFQSSNNGTNWTNTSTGLPAYDIRFLTVSGSDIYAATFGVYKSSNNGLLWTKLNQTWNANVNSVAVSGSTILAATQTAGIYMSSNGGANWNTINTGLPTAVNAVTIVGSTFLAGTSSGLYISTNNGSSWTATSVTDGIGSFTSVGSNVFAGSSSGGGVFLSTNSGGSWSAINNGLTNLTVYSLATNSTYVFAGTTGYVWKRLLSEVLPVTYTIATSSNPSNGGTTTGGGTYSSGNSVTVSATANNGFAFDNWTESGNIVSANSTYTFTASANRNLVANFSATTSIQDQATENIVNIFPNPSNGNFTLNSDKICNIKIYNSIGQLTLSKENVSGLTELNINGSGTYLIISQEKNSNKISKKQIVIQ